MHLRRMGSCDEAIEDWPWLDQEEVRTSRSHQVCMTCHFSRHHPGPDPIPLLTCHLHQCWTDDKTRQQGWAPEVA